MKKHFIFYFAVCLCLLKTNNSNAQMHISDSRTGSSNIQNNKGRLFIDIGAGYSPGFNGKLSLYPVSTNQDYQEAGYPWEVSSYTPNIGATIDYCIINRLSLGIAASYQKSTVTIGGTHYYDNITRVNMAGRLLFQLNKRNINLDHYIGLRIGCSYWHDIPGSTGPNPPIFYFLNEPNKYATSFQVVYGLRYYLDYHVGLQFEVGLGSPYCFEAGIAFRLGKHQTNKKAQ